METNVKHDLEELARSLSGFDEIAIEQYFRTSFEKLQGTMTARALLFVAKRREGMNDRDAFKSTMDMRIDDLEDQFEVPQQSDEEESGKA